MLVDLNAATRKNSLVTRVKRRHARTMIVGTSESFGIGQVVRVAADPLRLQTGENNHGGLVLRKATQKEFIAAYPSATQPHNAPLLEGANFYEVGVD
jgi:hypothetical protein